MGKTPSTPTHTAGVRSAETCSVRKEGKHRPVQAVPFSCGSFSVAPMARRPCSEDRPRDSGCVPPPPLQRAVHTTVMFCPLEAASVPGTVSRDGTQMSPPHVHISAQIHARLCRRPFNHNEGLLPFPCCHLTDHGCKDAPANRQQAARPLLPRHDLCGFQHSRITPHRWPTLHPTCLSDRVRVHAARTLSIAVSLFLQIPNGCIRWCSKKYVIATERNTVGTSSPLLWERRHQRRHRS